MRALKAKPTDLLIVEGLTYNTATEHLVIPAYGRYVQQMIEHAVTLDHERQQALVERIVRMMAQQYGDQDNLSREDQERRLWKHAYRMSGYRLTAVPPDGRIPQPEDDSVRPEEVPYPKPVPSHRNYGEYVQKMIERAIAVEDPERRQAITRTVASYMKLAYSTYNDEQNISDRTILNDMKRMSDGKLSLEEDANIDAFMGKGSQSHLKQVAVTGKGRKRSRGKSGNRRRFRKR